MTLKIFEERIKQYAPENVIEQENVIKELLQQCILSSLSRTGFFTKAMFHGGTCLKIFQGLPRFSEDLDFLLINSDTNFSWAPHLERVVEEIKDIGIKFQVIDRSDADQAVKKTFIKTDSIGKVVLFDLPFDRDVRKNVRVKLEVDTDPPKGSSAETHFLTFPSVSAVATQTLQGGFALKLHALLCRPYDKGRDWYDLVWYISRRIRPDLELMKNAMLQSGQWKGMQELSFDKEWLIKELSNRISKQDWKIVRSDVERFISQREQGSLDLWDASFFLYQVSQLSLLF